MVYAEGGAISEDQNASRWGHFRGSNHPLDQSSANWIFQVVSRRYEKKSPIVLTSNRGFSDWGQVFADQVVATAIVDRLIDDAIVINIRGRSYRMRAAPRLQQREKRALMTGSPKNDATGSLRTPGTDDPSVLGPATRRWC